MTIGGVDRKKKDTDRSKGKGRRFCLSGWFYSIPCYIPVQFILLFKIVLVKTASAARNWKNSSPETEGTTIAFSSVFTHLQWVYLRRNAEVKISLPWIFKTYSLFVFENKIKRKKSERQRCSLNCKVSWHLYHSHILSGLLYHSLILSDLQYHSHTLSGLL